MHNDVSQSLLHTPTFNYRNSYPYWGCRYPWASILAKMLPRQSEPCSAKWVGKHSLVRRPKAWKALDGRWESRSIKYLENHQRLRKIMVRPYSSAEGNAYGPTFSWQSELCFTEKSENEEVYSKTFVIGLTIKIDKCQAKLLGSQTVGC